MMQFFDKTKMIKFIIKLKKLFFSHILNEYKRVFKKILNFYSQKYIFIFFYLKFQFR